MRLRVAIFIKKVGSTRFKALTRHGTLTMNRLDAKLYFMENAERIQRLNETAGHAVKLVPYELIHIRINDAEFGDVIRRFTERKLHAV